MTTDLRISLLGSFQVDMGGETLNFRTDAQRVLLAYLAAHQATPLRRDTLAGLLSPDRPDKESLVYLSNRLGRLRKTIGSDNASPPWLTIDRKQITLRNGDDILIDSIQFDELLATVDTHPHRTLAGCPPCLAALQSALDFVRGELLSGLNFHSDIWQAWLVTQREYFQQRALEAMTLLRDARRDRREWGAVLALAQRQLTLEPWMETAHRAVMQAHYHLADRNAALAQYEACVELLFEELGVDPEPETIALHKQLVDDTGSLEVVDVPDNLPVHTGAFFGRKSQTTQLFDLLVNPANQLVTIVGTGGIGKTRLATEIGRKVQLNFPDGVWFVPLSSVTGGAEQIKLAVGDALKLAPQGKQLTGAQVLNILRDKRVLLIFDNSEPVLEDLAFIPGWLQKAPALTILATSREPLYFQAESIVMLDGLENGIEEPGAAELMFAEWAGRAQSQFELNDDNLQDVRTICELVDGSPLGIALAAAWVRLRTLAQIIESITNSLELFTTRFRDIDPRHRSVHAVIETSWELLSSMEQDVLSALSVFPESFSAEAANVVASGSLSDLDTLCDKSLLQRQKESPRYGLHKLIRHFASNKLAQRAPDINRAFSNYYYQYAQLNRKTYSRLKSEWPNFTAAIEKAHAAQSWQMLLDFVQMLDEPRFRRGRFTDMRQGLLLAGEAAKELGDESADADLLLRLGEVEMEQNDYISAESHLNDALARFTRLEHSAGIGDAIYLTGRIKIDQSRDEEALALFTRARDIFEQFDEPSGVAKSLTQIATYHLRIQRDPATAEQYLRQSLEIQNGLPLTHFHIETLRRLARVRVMLEDFESAEELLLKAGRLSEELQDAGEAAVVQFEQVDLYKRIGQIETALRIGYACLDNLKNLGSLRLEALVLTQLGLLHQKKGETDSAEKLLKDSLISFQQVGDRYEEAWTHYYLFKLFQQTGKATEAGQSRLAARQLSFELEIFLLQNLTEL